MRSLGHAGLELKLAGARILCDPWFSPEGAFQGSWFQYPDNSHLLDHELVRPDAILISHEHMDHIDPWRLEQVPDHIPVYIPHYASDALRRKILQSRRRPLIELNQWQFSEVLPGVKVMFVSEESPMNQDSAMVVVAEGKSLLNMNDARLSAAQVREIKNEAGGSIDVLALQGAGASWFPMCYEYPSARMAELALSKRHAKLRYLGRMVQAAKPIACLPFAGPPCFLDDELFHHNSQLGPEGVFPDQRQVVDWLSEQGLDAELFFPGDTWDSVARRRLPGSDDSFLRDPDYLDGYAERRRSEVENVRRRHPEPSADLWPAFEDYFGTVVGLSRYFNQQINMRVGFDLQGPGGGFWAVDLRPGSEGVFPTAGDCQYTYRFDTRWLPPILEGKVPWEDFFLSLRFRAWRHPDAYNDHLLGLLKLAQREPLQAVEDYESAPDRDEMIEIHVGDVTYRIQRFCPHAGQDLRETAEVLPGGILRCLGHHYEFDLETGQCVNGRAKTLRTERLVDGSSAGTS
ncbi:MAG: MBL fold metallo-hydrolase [Acidimicrobiia bacterium]